MVIEFILSLVGIPNSHKKYNVKPIKSSDNRHPCFKVNGFISFLVMEIIIASLCHALGLFLKFQHQNFCIYVNVYEVQSYIESRTSIKGKCK